MRQLVLVVLTLCLVIPSTSNADEAGYPVRAVSKFSRGIMNIVMCPIEIPVNFFKEGKRASDEDVNAAYTIGGLMTGLITGTGYMIARAGSGVWDVATFVWPTEPLMEPATPDGFIETIAKSKEPTRPAGTATAHTGM